MVVGLRLKPAITFEDQRQNLDQISGLYICASASTPVAAALILKGISPGAALVFLLAGPATNAATLTLVGRFWGRATTLVYLASIAVCSLTLGAMTDLLYSFAGWDIVGQIQAVVEHEPSLFANLAAVLVLVLWGINFLPSRRKVDNCCDCSAEKDT